VISATMRAIASARAVPALAHATDRTLTRPSPRTRCEHARRHARLVSPFVRVELTAVARTLFVDGVAEGRGAVGEHELMALVELWTTFEDVEPREQLVAHSVHLAADGPGAARYERRIAALEHEAVARRGLRRPLALGSDEKRVMREAALERTVNEETNGAHAAGNVLASSRR